MDSDSSQHHTSRESGPSRRNIPSSSTFRRLPLPLPGLTKHSLGIRRDRSSSTSSPPATHTQPQQRASLSAAVVEDDRIFSAFFEAGSRIQPPLHTESHDLEQEKQANAGLNFNNLLPPSRSSSLSPSPVQLDAPSLSPFPDAAPPNMATPDIDSLEPVTYPSHLAQATPPEAAPSPFPIASNIRSSSRQRDVTMGSGSNMLVGGAFDRSMSPQPGVSSPVMTSRPGSGGPPSGIPRRKDSITATPDLQDGGAKLRSNGIDRRVTAPARAKDETDSGDETTRRRRAMTRSHREQGRARKHSSLPQTATLPSGKISRAPAATMYFSPLPSHGTPPSQPLRAHTGTLVGDRIWFLGGVDSKNCWRGAAWFDTETLEWTALDTTGETMPPLRAHTTTLVGDKLYIFGGGDGPTYSNDVWTFDTVTRRFSRPTMARGPVPPPRRAHTTILYRNYLVVFGGGNGQAALNDVWALDVSDPSRLTWQEWRTRGDLPQKKGYHTANLVGDKMVIFGGSDGHASFADVHILNLQTLTWTLLNTEIKHNRLSHTSTQVGSYLFIIGGHNGQTYAQDVLLFNLVTLQWETKHTRGLPPPGRGYHVALLHDARIFISGGYNGVSVFDDLWVLDLSAGAYLPQVTTFEVDEGAARVDAQL